MNLGLDLQDQVIDQTEELRKKRQLEAQQRALLGVGGTRTHRQPHALSSSEAVRLAGFETCRILAALRSPTV
jgi:hypothetical protein